MGSDERRRIVQRNVRLFREQRGCSQEQLAREAGLAVRTVARYEAGTSYPDTDALVKLADALARSLDDFFLAEPPPPDPARQVQVRYKLEGEIPEDLAEKTAEFFRSLNREMHARAIALKAAGRRGRKL